MDRLHDVVKGLLDKLQVLFIVIDEALEIVHGSQYFGLYLVYMCVLIYLSLPPILHIVYIYVYI